MYKKFILMTLMGLSFGLINAWDPNPTSCLESGKSLSDCLQEQIEPEKCGGWAQEISDTSLTWDKAKSATWKSGIVNGWMPNMINIIKRNNCKELQKPFNDLRKKAKLDTVQF